MVRLTLQVTLNCMRLATLQFRWKILQNSKHNKLTVASCYLCWRLLPKKIFWEPFQLPTLKVSSPSHFFKSPELINSSCVSNLRENEDELIKTPVWATCSEIWSPTRTNKVPQATVRQQLWYLMYLLLNYDLIFSQT